MSTKRESPFYLCKATKGQESFVEKSCKWPLSLMDFKANLELVPDRGGEYITVSHVWSPNS